MILFKNLLTFLFSVKKKLFFCAAYKKIKKKKVINFHRTYLLLLLLLAFTSWCRGQDTDDVFFPKVGIGANAFMNFSTIDFKPSFNQTYLMGNGGGLVLNYITERYQGGLVHKYTGVVHSGIQLEFNLQQRGWKEDTDSTPDIYRQNITYFEVPFLSHITWGKRDIKYVVDFGPYFGYLYSSKNQTLYTGPDSLYVQRYFGREPDSKFEYGFLISPGLYYSSNAGVFSLQFRFTQGMNLVFDEIAVTDNRTLRRSYNKSIQFVLGYHFPISRKRTIVYNNERPKKKKKAEEKEK